MKLISLFTGAVLALNLSNLVAAPTILRGPYLQTATPTSIVVRWRTDVTEESQVNYGTDRAQLTLSAKAQGVSTEHVVQLSGLQPGTRYFYRVSGGAEKIDGGEDAPATGPISAFTTPPVAGPAKPTRVWVLGDPGTKSSTQAAVRDGYLRFTGARATDLWLILGDNAYPDGTDADYQKAVFEM
ncbi:MAG: fibronectin type III domain-containing protein, partial [Opitutaceae bacterium]